eukprot:957183-Rhodomonas_salina.2
MQPPLPPVAPNFGGFSEVAAMVPVLEDGSQESLPTHGWSASDYVAPAQERNQTQQQNFAGASEHSTLPELRSPGSIEHLLGPLMSAYDKARKEATSWRNACIQKDAEIERLRAILQASVSSPSICLHASTDSSFHLAVSTHLFLAQAAAGRRERGGAAADGRRACGGERPHPPQRPDPRHRPRAHRTAALGGGLELDPRRAEQPGVSVVGCGERVQEPVCEERVERVCGAGGGGGGGGGKELEKQREGGKGEREEGQRCTLDPQPSTPRWAGDVRVRARGARRELRAPLLRHPQEEARGGRRRRREGVAA